MPKQPETTEKLYNVRVSNLFEAPKVNGLPPKDRKGNPLPILVLVAFADDPQRKKTFPFFGDDEHLLNHEEYLSACFQKVPKSVNHEGVIPHPFVIVKEVS